MVEFGTSSAFRGWVRARVLGYGFGVRGRKVKSRDCALASDLVKAARVGYHRDKCSNAASSMFPWPYVKEANEGTTGCRWKTRQQTGRRLLGSARLSRRFAFLAPSTCCKQVEPGGTRQDGGPSFCLQVYLTRCYAARRALVRVTAARAACVSTWLGEPYFRTSEQSSNGDSRYCFSPYQLYAARTALPRFYL